MLLRSLSVGDINNALLGEKETFLLAKSLTRKGLADAVFNYDEIVDIKISYEGKAYMSVYPSLRNPINWDRIIALATLIISALGITQGVFELFW